MDWIDTFMEYSAGISSPPIFRLWTAIGIIAGSMERRVWAETSSSRLYPHLYTLLVAPPGVGKSQAVDLGMELVYAAKSRGHDGINIAPDSVSRASLIDALGDASRKILNPAGGLIEYHSLFVAAPEFGVLCSAHDLDFLSVLNAVYDGKRGLRDKKRGNNLDKEIIGPQLNILAGTQPGFLGSIMPEEAWTMGFTSRLLLIYSAQPVKVKIFSRLKAFHHLKEPLVTGLQTALKTVAEVSWAPEVMVELEKWWEKDLAPVPQHSKLQHYLPRRITNILKLCMVSAMSDGQRVTVEESDFLRAQRWLLEAEKLMPDIFRDMVGKSDAQILQELHFFMWGQYIKDKKPLTQFSVYNWLSVRCPGEKIKFVLDTAEKSGMVKRTALGDFIPRPKHEHGEE